MSYSTLTRKGQTTIPKDVRKFLGLSAKDKIVYHVDEANRRVIITPITGTILGLRGVVPHKGGAIDFAKLRKKTKKLVAVKYKGKK